MQSQNAATLAVPAKQGPPTRLHRRQDAWHEHHEATVDGVEKAKLEDLEWADGFALGTPTRYGLPAAQLKEFIDQTGPLWAAGHLTNKVATSFTSSANPHGGQESTLLALNNIFYHFFFALLDHKMN